MSKKAVVNNEMMEKAAELTRKTALVTLKSGVEAAEAAEGCVQAVYKAGYDANIDALKAAKNYWDATGEIRRDWIRLFAATGENLINATAKMELPLQKEIVELGRNLTGQFEKSVENLNAQSKTAAK